MRQLRLLSLSLAVSVMPLTGCAYFHSTTSVAERPDPKRITAEDIASSGTSNAWDLLRAKARGYDFGEDRQGRPRSIRSRRGRSSIAMSDADTPMIVITNSPEFFQVRPMSPATTMTSSAISTGFATCD